MERGAWAAMVERGTQEAMADYGAQAAMVDPGTQEAMADHGARAAMVDPGTQEAMAEQGARAASMAGSPPPPKKILGKLFISGGALRRCGLLGALCRRGR